MPLKRMYTYICSYRDLGSSFVTSALIVNCYGIDRRDLVEFRDKFHHGNKNNK